MDQPYLQDYLNRCFSHRLREFLGASQEKFSSLPLNTYNVTLLDQLAAVPSLGFFSL
ncbi:hypothetical protein XM38_005730 [Halomicronema hongdechloris C2206]|uniref:Uncharacterized protein n=1 Tax=Halomicronema hongdechloris C2206 TaxID=1641165 RepID=A0A1Z3HH76_9CYAN|nr:hypothetical protein [Halomicronema hongdechloris]ASC69644.1 hypothetical protein XM38_005730 [Halomicronema hongdechloris C2206]